MIGWTVLAIVGALAVLSTRIFVIAIVEVHPWTPLDLEELEFAGDLALPALLSVVFGLSSLLLWVLFAVVLYFTW